MLKRILTAVLICAALARGAFCAPSFTQEPGVRLASATLNAIIPVSAGFRMYFSTPAAFGVFSATSTDGVTWGVENGVRISTTLGGAFSSSITALGAYSGPAITSGPFRSYFVGLSSSGLYSILSATSTDGLAWGRDPDFLMSFNGGSSRVLSLAPFYLGAGKAVLYYTRDDGGAPDPAAFKVYAATSTDGGNSFSGETRVIESTGIFSVAVSSLTDGTIRLFATTALPNGTTSAKVLAADSENGLLFGAPALVYSTNPVTNVLGSIAVTRSTDTYSWRLHMNLRLSDPATDYVLSAFTAAPTVRSFVPGSVFNDDPLTNFTLKGEIFASTPTVQIKKGAVDAVPVVLVTRISDMQLTVRANPNGAPIGSYAVTAFNPDLSSGILANALIVDFKPGFVVMLDNLFYPLKGGTAKVTVNTFYPGNITAKIYDLNGGLVKTLANGPAASGANLFPWDGSTDSGATAASGLYLLRIKGPKTDVKEKIVLIK